MSTIFTSPRELLDFAEKFLNERLGSLKRDLQICIKENLPFPVLLYCFATVDLLGSQEDPRGEKDLSRYRKIN